MDFSIEQLTDLVVNAIPTLALIGFVAYLLFGGGLGNIVTAIATNWLFG